MVEILFIVAITALVLALPTRFVYSEVIKGTRKEIELMKMFGREYVLNETTGHWHRIVEHSESDKYIEWKGKLLRLSKPETIEDGTFYTFIGEHSGVLLRRI